MPEIEPHLLEKYQAAVAASPQSAEAHCNLGWGYYGLRQYDAAIKALKEAVGLDPAMIDAHYGLALALKESGATAEAIESFQIVVNLAPQSTNAVRGHMLARLAKGHINQINSGDWSLDIDLKQQKAV
jgi:tetratricopeptide (TPR) repeat protein